MFCKTLLLSVVITITASQSCSRSDVLRAKITKLPCVSKLEAYQAMIGHVKDKLDKFYDRIDNEPLGLASREVLQRNRTQFEHRISHVLYSLGLNIQTLNLVKNTQRRQTLCRAYLGNAANGIEKLSKGMSVLNKQLMNELTHSGLPWTAIREFENPIMLAAKITIALDLSIKASQGLMKMKTWTLSKVQGLGVEARNLEAKILAEVQKRYVARFETSLNDVIEEELGAANIGPEAEAAVQRSAAAVVRHLRSGNEAFEAAGKANAAEILEAKASQEATLLTEAASSSGVAEDAVVAARAAQAARASQVLRAAQASRLEVATRAAQAGRIAETADAAEAMSIAVETAEVAVAEGALVAEGAVAAGTEAGIAGTVASVIGVAAPYAFGVIFLIEIANVAIKFAHEEYLKHHVDESVRKVINESKRFGKHVMDWLLVTMNVEHY